MMVSVELTDWAVIVPANMGAETRSFVKLMQQTGQGQGFQIPDPA